MSEPPDRADDATTNTVLAARAPSEATAYAATVIEGPEAGATFTLDGSEAARVLVGTSPVCDVRLTDPKVSRRHVALQLVGRRLRVTDEGSTNGTFVDGLAVADAFLRGGETIRVGSSAMRIEAIVVAPRSGPGAGDSFGKTIGASPAMRRLYPTCRRLADSNITVVLEGDTGTGKEVLAESLHEEGPRHAGPFVVFDCTGAAPTLVESALFGHERGAFTGATAAYRGVFEQASGGTLLIDEIGDLELPLQAKLLRVLQRGQVRRVGGDREVSVDVRVLAATRRNLDREVQAGRFRDDLFFRLAVARLELPPLREREGDVPLLAARFWSTLGGGPEGIPFEVLRRFEDYPWPGNVRELYNSVARLIALGHDAPVGVEMAASDAGEPPRDYLDEVLGLDLPLVSARHRVVEEFERRYVERLLAKFAGDTQRAAAAAGIARRYFQLLRARFWPGSSGP